MEVEGFARSKIAKKATNVIGGIRRYWEREIGCGTSSLPSYRD